ncbi:hypothetical protein FB567DRAFT_547229 [Paraphoma chrysanthemicola]|uniref:Ankyrin n=1 Tax=Paraphoma chrysanthemicola TaxID=798071 RepID=A0A8K0W197_9PLEO|nr:hypothetical protein FB567DRAFT_547229 [Paraphoma chrysanthemicola]
MPTTAGLGLLPPEILGQILRYVIQDYEVIERLPLAKFKFPNLPGNAPQCGCAILRSSLLSFLQSPLRQASKFNRPTRLIIQLAEKVIELDDNVGKYDREAVKQRYVHILTRYLAIIGTEWTLGIILQARRRKPPRVGNNKILAAAAIVGSWGAMRRLASKILCELRRRDASGLRASSPDSSACLAVQSESIEAFRTLSHLQGFRGFDRKIFEVAVKSGQRDFIRRAIHKGFWTMTDGLCRDGGLFESVIHRTRDIAELLIDSGADSKSVRAWRMAERHKDIPMLRFLAQNGAKVAVSRPDLFKRDSAASDCGSFQESKSSRETKMIHHTALKLGGRRISRPNRLRMQGAVMPMVNSAGGDEEGNLRVSATLMAPDSDIDPGATLFGQALINVGF